MGFSWRGHRETLTSIVDDYLNITRIELGTMKYAFETIDLRTLIEDVLAELKPNIQKAPVAFSFMKLSLIPSKLRPVEFLFVADQ